MTIDKTFDKSYFIFNSYIKIIMVECRRNDDRNVYLMLSLNTIFFIPFKLIWTILIAPSNCVCVCVYVFRQQFLFRIFPIYFCILTGDTDIFVDGTSSLNAKVIITLSYAEQQQQRTTS